MHGANITNRQNECVKNVQSVYYKEGKRVRYSAQSAYLTSRQTSAVQGAYTTREPRKILETITN